MAIRALFVNFYSALAIFLFIVPCDSHAAEKKPIKVEYYQSDNVTNEIPYFDNRFHIDAEIDELTLLFYRSMGSEPIILVRPDGSKLRVNNFPKETVQWYDDSTFDMIKMKKPMPGPWQAIGNIFPNSKIMVVSDVNLVVDPLPETILTGETLKVKGRLYNGDKAINNPLFRDVVTLNVDFYSTNNSAYENFGADAVKIASFRDDGYDLDEYAKDNIFTGEFVLDFAPGEWQPIYIIKLPMATRELRQKPIILQPSPISISVEKANNEGQFHKVKLTIDPKNVDVDSLIFQGKITFPDKQLKPFSIMNKKGKSRVFDVAYTEPGLFRINVSAFGETLSGREFRLVVPEFSFNVEAIAEDLLEMVDGEVVVDEEGKPLKRKILSREEKEAELALKLEQARIEYQEKEALKQQETLIAIAVANFVIIFVAFIAYMAIRWRRNKLKRK
jgi:uncharacterized protein (TIGR03503 family)